MLNLYKFDNFENDSIHVAICEDQLVGTSFYSNAQALDIRNIGFLWSLRPENENDTPRDLLFREIKIIIEDRKLSNFKFFKLEENEVTVKFCYNSNDPTTQQLGKVVTVASVIGGFTVLVLGGPALIGAGLLGSAYAISGNAFSSPVMFDAKELNSNMATGFLGGAIPCGIKSLIKNIPVISSIASETAKYLPLGKEVIEDCFVEGGVNGPCDVIAKWWNAKPIKLDRLSTVIFRSLAEELITNRVSHAVKILSPIELNKVVNNFISGAIAAGSIQAFINLWNKKEWSKNVVFNALYRGALEVYRSTSNQPPINPNPTNLPPINPNPTETKDPLTGSDDTAGATDSIGVTGETGAAEMSSITGTTTGTTEETKHRNFIEKSIKFVQNGGEILRRGKGPNQ